MYYSRISIILLTVCVLQLLIIAKKSSWGNIAKIKCNWIKKRRWHDILPITSTCILLKTEHIFSNFQGHLVYSIGRLVNLLFQASDKYVSKAQNYWCELPIEHSDNDSFGYNDAFSRRFYLYYMSTICSLQLTNVKRLIARKSYVLFTLNINSE